MRKPFQFKSFAVQQAKTTMPVTTDACIFGAMFDLSNCSTGLDIGAGTGILSLMAAQRFSDLQITAVERDADAFSEAAENAAQSPWAERIRMVQADILEWHSGQSWDAIWCNPPFFEGQLASDDIRKRAARHADHLNYRSLLRYIAANLNKSGRAFLLIPLIHLPLYRKAAVAHALHVHSEVQLKSLPEREAHVAVLRLGWEETGELNSEFCTYSEPKELSGEAKELLRNFYLFID
jgi:tRNA1Val (adenine37-N6)-methyltransferase